MNNITSDVFYKEYLSLKFIHSPHIHTSDIESEMIAMMIKSHTITTSNDTETYTNQIARPKTWIDALKLSLVKKFPILIKFINIDYERIVITYTHRIAKTIYNIIPVENDRNPLIIFSQPEKFTEFILSDPVDTEKDQYMLIEKSTRVLKAICMASSRTQAMEIFSKHRDYICCIVTKVPTIKVYN